MRLLCFAAIAALAYVTRSRAQGVATVVVYVTVPPSSPPTFAAIIPQAASTELQQQDDQPTPSPSSSHVTSSTSSHTPSPTSQPIHEATSSQTYPSVTAASSTASADYEPGSPGGGQVDTAGGASGSDAAAFRLSKGGLAAILIVVILVSLFGSKCDAPHRKDALICHTVTSIVLFIVAKRRQWTMRQTLTRVSRRLTGRFGQPKTPQTASAVNRSSRRTGIRMGSPPRPGVKAVYPPGHKRGLVVDVKDPEKGPQPLDGKAPKNTRPRENTWIQRLWGDGWK